MRSPHCKLILARHGETTWNRARKFQGSQDIPLSSTGKEQAIALASLLSGTSLHAIYSSHLKRAVETASIVASQRNQKVHRLEDLREGHFGQLEGKPYDEEASYSHFLHFKSHLPPISQLMHKMVPDQEAGISMFKRASKTLEMIGERHMGRRVLVVTHGGIMRVLLAKIAGLEYESLQLKNAHPYQFEYRGGKLYFLGPFGR